MNSKYHIKTYHAEIVGNMRVYQHFYNIEKAEVVEIQSKDPFMSHNQYVSLRRQDISRSTRHLCSHNGMFQS